MESVVKDMRREAIGEAIYVDVVREWFRHEVPNFSETFSKCRLRELEI